MRPHLRWLTGGVMAAVLAAGISGCKKDQEEGSKRPGAAPPPGVRLQKPQRIPGTSLSVALVKGWSGEGRPGADKALEGPPPGLIDLSETREVWKATVTSPTGRVDPFISVSVDPRLPKGTSARDYLDALRQEQAKAQDARVRHLETERIERDGRPGYSVRDELDVPAPTGASVPVVQFARVFVDGTMGIAVTAMILADDMPQLDAQLRAIMDSLAFTTPAPSAGEESGP